jgi:hypothetical protein
VNSEGVVSRKPITMGPLVDGLRVVRTGLTSEDVVIIKGLQRARPGNKVAPKQEQIRLSEAAPPGPRVSARP